MTLAIDFGDSHLEKKPTKIDFSNNIEEWKQQLVTSFDRYQDALNDYNAALSAMEDYYNVGGRTKIKTDAAIVIFEKWLKNLCSNANKYTNNKSQLRISVDELPSALNTFSYPTVRDFGRAEVVANNIRAHDATFGEVYQFLIDNYDFDGLAKNLSTLVDQIEERGYSAAAEKLGNFFKLQKCNRDADELILRVQKGSLIVPVDRYAVSVSSQTVSRYNEVRSAAQAFETESGLYDLDSTLALMAQAEWELGFDEKVPSRASFGAGSDVSCTYFKSGLKFHFSHAFFEGLISFIKSYSSTELRDISIR